MDMSNFTTTSISAEVLETNNVILVAVSTLSLISSIIVVSTGAFFFRKLVHKKLFMKLIMTVSVCDGLGVISGILGYVRNRRMAMSLISVYWVSVSLIQKYASDILFVSISLYYIYPYQDNPLTSSSIPRVHIPAPKLPILCLLNFLIFVNIQGTD